MSWYSFQPYVSVAERRRKAAAAAKKLSKKRGDLAPVQIGGTKIASTFWGKSWCANLESYSDYSNRLPRGRTYVRNGSVIDLRIANGKIEALVQGSELYEISIDILPLNQGRWRQFTHSCSGKFTNLLELLQGRLSKEILADITTQGTGLFPAPKEITLDCSCPDGAGMCKHIAAVLYGVGARLDTKPEIFFTLRGVDMQDLIHAASSSAVAPTASSPSSDSSLVGADLSEIFGVEIESTAETKMGAPKAPPIKPVLTGGKKPPKAPKSSSKNEPKLPAKRAATRSKKRVPR